MHAALGWLEAEFIDQHARDNDYVAANKNRPSISTAADVLTELENVAVRHPVALVRERAWRIYDQLDDRYNVVDGETVGEMSRQEGLAWMDELKQLIELVHVPEHED